ncbi:MAG: TolC family protein [Bacteroidales bacterium]|nr:TolC family protein [Bacteroidales bacterium]MBN2764293.1 TolC family protein [Bacteroidales bacterium]
MAGNNLNAQEEPFRLTLAQAREYALQHNKKLLNDRDQSVSSKEMVRESIAQGLPQINGTLDYMTYFNYEFEFSMGGGSAEPDIDYTLLDAGDLQVLSAIGQMFSSEPIIMDDQFSGNIQVSQLIFSGQYIAGIQAAKIARRLADQSVVASELDIKENVTNSYFVILTTEQTLLILAENLDNLNEIQKHTQNLYMAGVAEETDVDQLKITVSQLKNTQKSLERMNQLNYNMLKFQLGVAPDANIVLADDLERVMEFIDSEAALSTDYDITRNINYTLVESQVELNEKLLSIQNMSYLPTVAGYYNYTRKFITTAFDLTPNHLAGFNVSVPIFSGGMRRAQVAQAKIDLNIARRNREIVKDQLETLQRQLLFNYQNALENFNTQKENVAIAGRVYKSIQNKYQQGLASSLDLTQANSNYLNAENNYMSAVLTLLQAQISLDKLYNKL